MDLEKTIKTRISIRNYLKKPIKKNIINKLIQNGINAPSACNLKKWKFIIIDNKKMLKKLVRMGAQPTIQNIPIGILVIYPNITLSRGYRDDIQSASAAIQNIILSAHSLNLGACWICTLPPKKDLRNLFKIPKNYNPIALISLGYYKKNKKIIEKNKDISNFISYNTFKYKNYEKKRFYKNYKIKRIIRKIYYNLPLFFRIKIKKYIENKK
jgi:nitroreductase